ncbi:hypothetical protein CDL15_Pgr005943 [Punica granatum]|nr:hypothetical protein CDL15_Pgr005943 [Punica granatum]
MARTRSLKLTTSPSSAKLSRALSDPALRDLSVTPRRRPFPQAIHLEEDRGVGTRTTASSQECEVGVLGGGLGRGGGICGGGSGGGGGGSDEGGSGDDDSSHGSDHTEAYYRRMIDANPRNPLILSNYGRFLKEVRGDYAKAKEYCGRSILADPNDGNVLSMFADLVWGSERDAERAEAYFDQALKVAPDDCYVKASYARFLWDAEEDGDEEVAEDYTAKTPTLSFYQTPPPPPPPPLAAAS